MAINYRYTRSGEEDLTIEFHGIAQRIRVHYERGDVTIIIQKGLFNEVKLPFGKRDGEINHFICDRFEMKV